MASRVTDQPLLQKISHRHLECQICMDRFKEPKMLECSHSYCLKCLQQLAETNPTSTKLTCPACRSESLLTRKGVFELRTDFKLISLLDDIREHETELQSQREIQPPGKGSVFKCSKHTGKDVIMYCDSCKQLICTTCIAKDHKMHPATELKEVVDNCKKKANEILAAVAQHHITFKIAMEDIGMSWKLLDTMFRATKAKISKKADEKIAEEVARIREEENNLVVELAQTYKDKATQIETVLATNNNEMTKAQNKQVVINHHMVEVNFFENLHLIEKLLQDLKDYTEIQPKQVTSDLTNIDFENDQKSFGRLKIKEEQKLGAASASETACKPKTKLTWTLKTERTRYKNRDKQIQNFCPLDVASFCNGDIVVCDSISSALIQISADSNAQSKVFVSDPSIKGIFKPRGVTVNKNDELIVVDHAGVKIFNRKYTCLHQFTLGGQPIIRPSCIAVDDNNLIAVGIGDHGKISLHKPDGTLITTLPAAGIGRYLTVHKQQLIYTNRFCKKMVSVDYNGGIVFSVDFKQSKYPRGLCCNKDGSIYVAVWDYELSTGEIHHYSPDGQYIGCIIKGCTDPNGITITPAGDLIVATYESVQIYCHG
ncbi:E3 ubiquitin-protein ligase TRIM7-like isoform X2 [Asterias rubens]|uniref:E3 ubiquitin-protein ligase TRIM7-like isoform X2 n=1 Tax=Asterias rubens TaxID=7604 RepID=UPI001454F128|nr:E3 ubiquitin-protein ligase TRIM7-like isoform X2 [Asterias rubens]